jgi:uncharacterized protein YycO
MIQRGKVVLHTSSTAPLPRRGFRIVRYGPKEKVTVQSDDKPAQMTTSKSQTQDDTLPVARPGDFILTHSVGVFGALIRFGEWLRYSGKDKVYSHWSHAAIFVDNNGDIVEALGGGVQKRNISIYTNTEYVVVHLPETTSNDDRQQAVSFAKYALNERYGWLTIISIALSLLTGAKLGFGIDGQQICSALVARCIERIGEIFTENEPWHVMPADLAKHFNVQLIGDKGQTPSAKEGITQRTAPGRSHPAP